MEADCIPLDETGYFSKIIVDYLSESIDLKEFYELYPTQENFKRAIDKKVLSESNRAVLADRLIHQYKNDEVKLDQAGEVLSNINLLRQNDSYTITTGHQLCLFTGPLYFIYKIVSTVKLCDNLKQANPNFNFIPVYWMATEDHDFAEVNHFNVEDKRFDWQTKQKGAVGRMELSEMEAVLAEFDQWLTDYSTNAEELSKLFSTAYKSHKSLAAATRYLVNELFGMHGVVILDGDDQQLKKLFSPILRKELLDEFSAKEVDIQNKKLAEQYKIQVNPREMNLFYLTDNIRERIVKENGSYYVNGTSLSFSEEEILLELDKHPERFSPNVILRPVYQEAILPNLAYIGGGGELAYWFQLKTTFQEVNIQMPVLILRNSVAWLSEKQSKVFDELGISNQQLFLEPGVLMKEWVVANSNHNLELTKEKANQLEFFKDLSSLASVVDKSLVDHVRAHSVKHQKQLDKLSEKFIRSERRKAKTAQQRIFYLKDTLFYKNSLQERRLNFSQIYLSHGKGMIDILLNNFETPTSDFLIIRY